MRVPPELSFSLEGEGWMRVNPWEVLEAGRPHAKPSIQSDINHHPSSSVGCGFATRPPGDDGWMGRRNPLTPLQPCIRPPGAVVGLGVVTFLFTSTLIRPHGVGPGWASQPLYSIPPASSHHPGFSPLLNPPSGSTPEPSIPEKIKKPLCPTWFTSLYQPEML